MASFSACRLIRKGSLSWRLISCHLPLSEEGISPSDQGCAGTQERRGGEAGGGEDEDGKQELSVPSMCV